MTGECCGICGVPHPGGVCRILQRHLDTLKMRGGSDTSAYTRRRALLRLGAALAPVCVLDATPPDLFAWRAALRVEPDTVAQYCSHARAFYTWATGEGIVTGNPAAGLPVPRARRRVPRPIGEDDLMRALPLLPQRILPWVVLAAWCGLRGCEIAELRRCHVLDKARPHPVLLLTATKGGRQRVVPIPPFALGVLLPLLPRAAGAYVFTRRDGQPGPNTAHHLCDFANKALHAAGVAETLHQLRHRYGTQLYQATKDLRLVQDLLGHADPRTAALYCAFADADAAAAAAALPVPRLTIVR